MAEPIHNERLHAMDALRAIAMLLGIALHAMMAYMVGVWDFWPAADVSSSPLFDAAFWTIHLFRMEVFFLMAGFFACLLLIRYGLTGYAKNRAGRIGAPLAVAMVTIVPITAFVWVWGLNLRQPKDARLGFWPAVEDFFAHRTVDQYMVPIHLWFLEHLLILCLIAGLLHVAANRLSPLAALFAKFADAWAWLVRHALAAPVLALLIFPILFLQRSQTPDGTWAPEPGVATQTAAIPPWHIVLYYAVFFTAGWLLCRRRDALASLGRFWYLALPAGVALALVYLRLLPRFLAGEDVILQVRLAAVAATPLLVVGFSGLFLCLFDRPSRVMRYVSDASYWMYLIHLPLVVLLNIALLPLEAPAIVKFLLVCVLAGAIMLGSYALFVRYTWIGFFLNGPRIRRERERRRGERPIGQVV